MSLRCLLAGLFFVCSIGFAMAGPGKSKTVSVGTPAASASNLWDHRGTLFTRSARTERDPILRSTFAAFSGVALEEVDDLEGFSFSSELTVPLGRDWQLSLVAPIYLDGEAKSRETGADVDLDGWGGTFDYPSLRLDWQIREEQTAGYDLALSFGAGRIFNGIWGSLDTSTGDVMNHAGTQLRFGLAYDLELSPSVLMMANAQALYFVASDDLIPGRGSSALLTDLSLAFVFQPSSRGIHPAIEARYLGNFSGFDALTVAPELIWPITEQASLTLGAVIGLTGEAEELGGRAQLSWRF